MSKPQFDRADASALLDDRGYRGALIRGQNPALLFEKGVRERITESYYWKEQCFGLNAATLCDRAADLKFIGGTTGINGKPTPFLCLAFKMLQLVPDKAIILEYLNFRDDDEEEEAGQNGDAKMENGDTSDKEEESEAKKTLNLNASGKLGDFKYLRCLAAFYIRLAWEPVDIYTTLEPLLTDYRKIKRRLKDAFTLTYVDQFIDDLLTKDRICATSLWKLPSRANLEDLDMLEPRESPLDGEVDELDAELERVGSDKSRSRSRSRSRSYDSRSRSRSRSRSYDSRSRSRSRSYDRSRSRNPGERRSRSRTRSRTRSPIRDGER
jgi:pre-mRNA-splicing factor 38A